MKFLSLTAIILLLPCCKSETNITPTTITSFEYGIGIGLTGQVVKLTILPQKQILKPYYNSSKTCEMVITDTEWKELTNLFDENAFKKVMVGEKMDCIDANSWWITTYTSAGAVRAIWGPCTGGDPTGIQLLVDALDKRQQVMQMNCK